MLTAKLYNLYNSPEGKMARGALGIFGAASTAFGHSVVAIALNRAGMGRSIGMVATRQSQGAMKTFKEGMEERKERRSGNSSVQLPSLYAQQYKKIETHYPFPNTEESNE